jgi:hypothetical protein
MKPSSTNDRIAMGSHRLVWVRWGLIVVLLGLLLSLVLLPETTQPVRAVASARLSLDWSSSEADRSVSIAWGDVDNDGDLDLATGNEGTANRLYRNDAGQVTQSASWSSSEADNTRSVAWGDVDGDGDLDLMAGNNGVNRLYRNDNGVLTSTAVWSSSEADNTRSVAWGDVDGDGDLDLMAGNNGVNRLYRNDNGILTPTAVWSSSEADDTRSVAWGDVDNDGDLDLMAGNNGVNRLYRNNGGGLGPTAVWESSADFNTSELAWGDLDNDGDADLVVANWVGPNELYRNNNGILSSNPVWLSNEADDTMSMALADVDGDGDLDLAVGNEYQPIRLYYNIDGSFNTDADWSDTGNDLTYGLAWGDLDNDGAPDLAAASLQKPNRLYRNQATTLDPGPGWSSTEQHRFFGLAWGDVDGDGDLDLAIGTMYNPIHLYENHGVTLDTTATWVSSEEDYNRSLAWGDVDNDGDLDLAAGNSFGANRLYRNDNGTLTNMAVWSSSEVDKSLSIAWGDVDDDGDLDLAVANQAEPNRLYRNDNGTLTSAAVWSSSETEFSDGIAWGDVDGDGDLDLAVANREQPDRVYRNDDGVLTSSAAWSSLDSEWSTSLAWGDVDGDGDLDLAVGSHLAANRLYRNDNGILTGNAVWRSNEADYTSSVAFGDMDGDGDLDLVAGSTGLIDPNRLYVNEGGQLNPTAAWSSGEGETLPGEPLPLVDSTYDLALADADGDGDLDLAVANFSDSSRIHFNSRNDSGSRVQIHLPNPSADFYGTARIVRQRRLDVEYTLSHPQGVPVRFIRVFYSPNGGGQWFPATPADGTATRNLAADPNGSRHTFSWQADQDLVKSDNLVLRIEAYDGFTDDGSYQRSYSATQSLSFRIETAEWFAQIVDEQGQPVAGANVIVDGAIVSNQTDTPLTSDRAGLVRLDGLQPGQQLIALSAPIFEQPTSRGEHDGWAYRVHTTSLGWSDDGTAQAVIAITPGRQRLVLRRSNPLVLFNLVVSLEWAASDAELVQFEQALQRASEYLFDISDGQMAFGRVLIGDNAQYWADADIQFLTNNSTRPHAYVGGITSADTSHVIRLGRAWDGITGSQGRWDAQYGYRTIVHEFGHYALGLYDSYFAFRRDANGVLLGQRPARCTGYVKDLATESATNATIMDHQYTSSELAMRGVAGLWAESCEQTAQVQLNDESDWETLLRLYSDTARPPRWIFTSPRERGNVLAGPDWPDLLLPNWPATTIRSSGLFNTVRHLTVRHENGNPQQGAIVALYKQNGDVLSQGLTDAGGQLDVYGAQAGDTLRVATLDGGYQASTQIGTATDIEMPLQPVVQLGQLQTYAVIPHIRIVPSVSPEPGQIALTVQLPGYDPGNMPYVRMTAPNEDTFTPPLSYSPDLGGYTGEISFSAQAQGTGHIQAVGTGSGGYVNRHSTFRLQQITDDREHEIFSDDGNFWLHLPEGSIPATRANLIVMPPGALPGPLPAGMTIIGEAYDITVSGALTQFDTPALLRFSYDAAQVHARVVPQQQIYRWDPTVQQWQALPSNIATERQVVTAPIRTLGVYALLQPTVSNAPSSVWLPLLCTSGKE